jgi:ribulose-phosphate 3-epimerase
LNPGTAIELVRPVLPFIGVVTVMSVNPGFSGQKFLTQSIARIAAVRKMIADEGLDGKVLIEVDGGVDTSTAGDIVAAGASILVAGNGVYGMTDRAKAIGGFKTLRRNRAGG